MYYISSYAKFNLSKKEKKQQQRYKVSRNDKYYSSKRQNREYRKYTVSKSCTPVESTRRRIRNWIRCAFTLRPH